MAKVWWSCDFAASKYMLVLCEYSHGRKGLVRLEWTAEERGGGTAWCPGNREKGGVLHLVGWARGLETRSRCRLWKHLHGILGRRFIL